MNLLILQVCRAAASQRDAALDWWASKVLKLKSVTARCRAAAIHICCFHILKNLLESQASSHDDPKLLAQRPLILFLIGQQSFLARPASVVVMNFISLSVRRPSGVALEQIRLRVK